MAGKKLQGVKSQERVADEDEAMEPFPRMEHFPAGQIRGETWVIGVLADLIAYSDHRDLPDLGIALRKAHDVAVQSLLN